MHKRTKDKNCLMPGRQVNEGVKWLIANLSSKVTVFRSCNFYSNDISKNLKLEALEIDQTILVNKAQCIFGNTKFVVETNYLLFCATSWISLRTS